MKNVLTSMLCMQEARLNKMRDSVISFDFCCVPTAVMELASVMVILCYSLKCSKYSDRIFGINGD